ncbi:MAG: hypothetical protein OXG59_08725 [Gammaproteobacteria bacterium]|nr:hypothetical protein [Gammaproteobacteria bacterium]
MNTEASGLRYQVDERPPLPLTIGLGAQLAALNLAAVMLIPTVVMRAAGQPEAYVSWAVGASVAICGLTTILQAFRFGRIGAGHMLLMGSSGAFVPVCVAALVQSGPAMLATLVVAACLVPLALSWRLSLFQRVLTPSVCGVVVMLIPISVLPIVGDMLTVSAVEGRALPVVLSAAATVTVTVGIALAATGSLRLWAPVIGVGAGSALAVFFGLYDFGRVVQAGWVDLPSAQWPGLAFGPEFFTLLPGFLLAGVIASVRSISGAIAIQRVSWRRSRALDFRAVQGAVAVDGVASFLSGLAGTVPNTTYSVSVSLAELTGVAARVVGVVAGAVFVALMLFPKAFAAILAIPDSVIAAYMIILMATLFMVGVRMVLQDGMDYRKALIVGLALMVGVSFQYGLVFPRQVSGFAGGLFANGMNAGGVTAIALSLFVELTRPRKRRLDTVLDLSVLAEIRSFLGEFASHGGWGAEMVDRLEAVSEEAVLILLREDDGAGESDRRRLLIRASREEGAAILEFIVTPRGENIQDRLALLGDQTDSSSVEQEVSLRLLRRLSSSVRHQQFHDTDIVTVRVKAPGG